ncbi:MAG: hypothetical protein ACKVWR_17395 [Acidimicrobiales bacterium]
MTGLVTVEPGAGAVKNTLGPLGAVVVDGAVVVVDGAVVVVDGAVVVVDGAVVVVTAAAVVLVTAAAVVVVTAAAVVVLEPDNAVVVVAAGGGLGGLTGRSRPNHEQPPTSPASAIAAPVRRTERWESIRDLQCWRTGFSWPGP